MKNLSFTFGLVFGATLLLAGCSISSNPLLEKSDQALDGQGIDQLEVEINQELMLDGEKAAGDTSPAREPADGAPSLAPSGASSSSGSGATDYKSLEMDAGAMVLESETLD